MPSPERSGPTPDAVWPKLPVLSLHRARETTQLCSSFCIAVSGALAVHEVLPGRTRGNVGRCSPFLKRIDIAIDRERLASCSPTAGCEVLRVIAHSVVTAETVARWRTLLRSAVDGVLEVRVLHAVAVADLQQVALERPCRERA